MRGALRVAIGLCCVLAPAGRARALTLLDDDRFIGSTVNGSVQCCVEPDFLAPFEASAPGSFQRSSISLSVDGLGLDGSAFVVVSGVITEQFEQIVGQGSFSIGFRTEHASTLQLNGEVGASGVAQQYAFVRVLAGGDVLFERDTTSSSDVFFDSSIPLPAGVYTIEATPFVSGFDASAGVDLELHLREVPEPASGLLLASALAALAAFGAGRRCS